MLRVFKSRVFGFQAIEDAEAACGQAVIVSIGLGQVRSGQGFNN